MSAQWNYMVEFLSDKTKPLIDSDSDVTDVHCLYVETLMLSPAAITRNPPHKAVVLPLNPRVDLSA